MTTIFSSKGPEMEACISHVQWCPMSILASSYLNPRCPLHLTADRDSLCVIIQHSSGTTVAMQEK